MRHAATAATALCAILVLAGCGTKPPGREPDATPVSAAAAASPVATALEKRLEEQVAMQERQGRLADEAISLELLAVLRPDDGRHGTRLAALKARIAIAVKDRIQRGDDAQKRGQTEVATTQYLAALALQPDHEGAANALRAIERDRNRKLLATKAKQKRPAPAPEIGD